jgi:transcriptional regulator with GAF, ATPase, and Fis domain
LLIRGDREDQAMSMARDQLDEQVVARRVDEVTSALERLAVSLEQDEQLSVVLQRVCRQVVRAVPDTDMASITLLRDGVPYTAAATGDEALRIDQAQYDAGQGPCLRAARTGELQRISAGEAARQWPDFAAAVGDTGVSSYLSAPLFIDHEYQGSLNFYGTASRGFGTLDAALLELYTTAAEAALRGARRYQAARETIEQLQTALGSRAVIDQAKGILMALHRVPADDAFELLVRQSKDRNVKLREVAERFVADVSSGPE